jgi:asparagine synthase (glutamine-hydrolysing)
LAVWVESVLAQKSPAFADLVDEAALLRSVRSLTQRRDWDWESVGRIWPYLHLKWILAKSI